MEIEGLASRVQALDITNEAHQQAIEDKDAALALLNDDLKNPETKYRPFSMKTWHCKHKGMYIRTSYKNVKTSLPILRHDIFLMREILVRTALSSLYKKMQHLPMISFMTCHMISRGYNGAKGMLN